MAIKVGDTLPADVKLKEMGEGAPKDVTVGEIFKGRKVVLFAVPGAFTPTCSMKHLPGFVEKADEIKKKGVDEIVCLSVNDGFVMSEWQRDQNAPNITFIPDGNGELTKALGLTVDASGYGMGTRSQRYAMIVEDGVVKELNIEAPGEFKVSAADYMLAQL